MNGGEERMRHPRLHGNGRWTLAGAAILTGLLLMGILATGGCTSDPANSVGSPLVEATYDTVLAQLQVEQIDQYTAFMVMNENILVHQQEILYIGEQQGTRSSLIANYDFAFEDGLTERDTVAYPDSLFTEENIKSVKFSLVKPTYYQAYYQDDDGNREDETGQPVDLYYLVQQLEAPFDSTAYTWYPNEVPAIQPGILNSDFTEVNDFDEPFLRLDARDFVEWFQAGEKIGIIVQFDDQSDPGLVGFGSRDMKKFSELSPQYEGTVVAPNFQVEFNDYVDDNQFFLMAPYADTSTFDQVPDVPTDPNDGVVLRTGLRSYPAMFFDYSALPANARINRAVLELNNDPTTSFGRYESLVVSEIDAGELSEPQRTITLATFRSPDYLYQLSGRINLDPPLLEKLELTAGEPPLTFSSGVSPDMYYRQFNFYGLSAAEDLRPKLRITYSLIEELAEGSE
jgi:hypothetical protein